MPSAKLVLGFTAIASVLTVPGLASAQTCASDAECGKGLSCQVDPSTSKTAVICRDGDAGGVCTPVPADASPSTCQLAACVTVADCGPEMICNSQTITTCTGGTAVAVKCDPTTGCDAAPVAPDPVICTDTTSSRCAYKWQMPCNLDADCGDGFTCQPTATVSCSGSSGSAPAGSTGTASAGAGGESGSGTGGLPAPLPSALDAGTPTPVTCTTTTSFPGSCQPKATTCTMNSDCPSLWTCEATNVGTGVSGGTATSTPTAPAGSAPMAVDAGASVAVPPPATSTVMRCQPPASATQGYGTPLGVDVANSTKGTADAGAATGSTTPPSPSVPTTNGGPGSGQTAATTGGGSGCSFADGNSASGPAWLFGVLAVLGLALARRSRRD